MRLADWLLTKIRGKVMGCDIHLHVEIQDKETGKWKECLLFRESFWDDERGYQPVSAYTERNYSLFTALCGVRDYTDGESPRISQPKGLPDDCSDTVKAVSYEFDGDGHSYSWNTLQELYDFQLKHKMIKRKGLVSQEQAKQLDYGILPQSWSQGSSDETKVWRAWEEKVDVLGGLIFSIEKFIEMATWFVFPRSDADRIRIVYWFDN